MAIPGAVKYHIPKFWDDEFKTLDYINEEFNDPVNVARWLDLGFANQFTGDMCDMRSPQPSWNHKFIEFFQKRGWHNIGTSYYRMMPGTILPTHGDVYRKYIELFDLHGKETTIRRAVVFLEDWQSGHYGEYSNEPFVKWHAGDTVEWIWDQSHMAANMGSTPRYTLQITGHI
jgi:hypothetical protein